MRTLREVGATATSLARSSFRIAAEGDDLSSLPEDVTKISWAQWGQTSLLVRPTGRIESVERQWRHRKRIL